MAFEQFIYEVETRDNIKERLKLYAEIVKKNEEKKKAEEKEAERKEE